MYRIGKHFYKHGRDMGYVLKREHEAYNIKTDELRQNGVEYFVQMVTIGW